MEKPEHLYIEITSNKERGIRLRDTFSGTEIVAPFDMNVPIEHTQYSNAYELFAHELMKQLRLTIEANMAYQKEIAQLREQLGPQITNVMLVSKHDKPLDDGY